MNWGPESAPKRAPGLDRVILITNALSVKVEVATPAFANRLGGGKELIDLVDRASSKVGQRVSEVGEGVEIIAPAACSEAA